MALNSSLRIAVITDPEHPGLRPDDLCLAEAFRAQGAVGVPLAWGSDLPADEYSGALIRTPWDYFHHPRAFLAWVDGLDVPVINPPSVLRWNHDKGYLLKLQEADAAVLPLTRGIEAGSAVDTPKLLDELGAARAVVKPAISGGAFGTRVVSKEAPLLWEVGEEGTYLAQPFVEAVTEEGEWSLTYFGGDYSHSVRKVPVAGDFRVQDDYGGAVHVEVAPAELREAADRTLRGVAALLGLNEPLTYARVDLVRQENGAPLLMELELIEPELFLRADSAAPGRLVEATLASLARQA